MADDEKHPMEELATWAWRSQEKAVTQAKAFVLRVLRAPRARRVTEERRRRTMPCQLYLTMGWNSVPLFPSGGVDCFSFFQRGGVSASHEVEYLARLDEADQGSEEYQPYGLFRLQANQAEALPNLETRGDLWERLTSRYGLSGLPSAQALASHTFTTFDPRYSEPLAGVNRIDPPTSAKAYIPARRRHYSYAEVLEILRAELDSPERIAWMELTFPDPPALGEIVHRYYLDEQKQAWLVRHHWAQGKQLFRAQTNAEALAYCRASGHFDRVEEERRKLAA
jgi:hypothetical protein